MHILGILTQVVEELNPKSINLRFIRFMSPVMKDIVTSRLPTPSI